MRFSRSWFVLTVTAVTLVSVVRAGLPTWAANAVAASALEAALFRPMALPDGPALYLRPADESRSELSRLIQQKPTAELYGIRAREEERAGTYEAAEADWKAAATAAQDKVAAVTELVDFYARRVEPAKEVSALLQLGALAGQPNRQFQAPDQQPQWAAFGRAITVAHEALMPDTEYGLIYDAWIVRYPKAVAPYQAYLDWTLEEHSERTASAVASRLKAAFPENIQLAVTTDAKLASVQRGSAGALAVYDQNFSPLWPDGLRGNYWEELTKAHQLRSFLNNAEAAITANPRDLRPVTQVFFYYEETKRNPAADAELVRFVSRREAQNKSWTSQELRTVAELFLRVQDYDEAARFYYALYGFSGASSNDKQSGLASIVRLLLDVPEQPLSLANRDLSLYKNIAQMDRHPGFLNGILTVALNTTYPEEQYQSAAQTASSYFHRAAASRLLDRLRQEFPAATQATELEAKLFAAYALYGQDDALLRDVPPWLSGHRDAPEYVDTALLLSDAYVRKVNTAEELALYDRLLSESAEKSGHYPLGKGGAASRSPDYGRVLDRYISRLVQLNRSVDALALFRREIDRNPGEAGLYERLALFVEQNHLDKDLEQTYRLAYSRFKDTSWASKLARFYLHGKQYAAYQALTRQITDTFGGTELAAFLTEVTPNSATLFRQVNLYAHRRFPHNTVFVSNLLHAYRTKPTLDVAAYDTLLRENWSSDPNLRTTYFEYLTQTGRLRTELAGLPSPEQAMAEKNLAALDFRAGGEAWLTEYESAAPVYVQLASVAKGDRDANGRAIAIERSLASEDAGRPAGTDAFRQAVQLAEQDLKAAPGERETAVRVGEIYADREQYGQARNWWNRVAAMQPGAAAGYLDSATVFWDYFQFDDALRAVEAGRSKLRQTALYAYEAGAIYENQSRYKDAVAEYVKAALQDESVEGRAQEAGNRLVTLARRKDTGDLVEQQTANLTANGFATKGLALRLSILESQNRRGEIEALLTRMVTSTGTTDDTGVVREAASRLGFDKIAAQALQKTVVITKDPIEKMQARLELARFYESHNGSAPAEREYLALLNDEPNRLGVIRAAVDYQWRAKQWAPAVQTLEAAAGRAQSPYQIQLRREAAEKANTSGQFTEARRLLDQLLVSDPYNGDLLAEKAATFSRQGNNAGLAAFYSSELKDMGQASLSPDDKVRRVAALRRGYVLALTTSGKFTEALEQYQLLLNAYPDDEGLTTEVSRFAENHQLAEKLTAYYTKATFDSPRDYRWPLILARVQSTLRHFPEAIAAYEKAGIVRPDRSDIPTARADLQMRTLKFEDAIKTYGKLYELSYHDKQYLVDQADCEARLGNRAEALRLLRSAYIEGQSGEAAGFVSAMREAGTWRMYDAVDVFFTEARPLWQAKPALKTQALSMEAEALVAMHRPADALALVAGMSDQPSDAAPLLTTIGTAARKFLTPEDRAALAVQIEKPNGVPAHFTLLQVAQAIGLRDLEAKALLTRAKTGGNENVTLRRFEQLQSSRLLYEQLGQEIEGVAAAHRRNGAALQQMEQMAFRAYAEEGDQAAQFRLMNYAGSAYAPLFVRAKGDLTVRLRELAGQNGNRANTVVQYLFSNASADVVVPAIAARGSRVSTLWTNSYTALAGLYFASAAPWADQAFNAVLGPRTVGGELTGGDAKNVLRGTNWFYYAGRYGDYLERSKQADAADYLASALEAEPAASNSYVALGDQYREANQVEQAAQLYRDAMQLSPERADLYDRLGLLAAENNQRVEAISQWRRAFQLLAARVEQGPLPAEYWTTAQSVLKHTNQFRVVGELKSDADAMLRIYIKRNGLYQFEPFLRGMFDGAPDSKATVDWVVALSQLPGADGFLRQVLSLDKGIRPQDKDAVYQAELARANKEAAALAGDAAKAAREDVKQTAIQYATFLGQQGRWAEEWKLLNQIEPADERPADLLLTAGALSGHLEELLKQYQSPQENRLQAVPSGEQVLQIASTVQERGHADLALRLEEFEYGRELQDPSAPASAWFGFARVRFAQKRNDEGLALIRGVTLSVGSPYSNLKPAADALEAAGLKTEARRYAIEWKTAEPWNEEAQLAAARLTGDAKAADVVRRSSGATYAVRVRAARLMRELGSSVAETDELAMLTRKTVSVGEAAMPFAVEARLEAAQSASVGAAKIRLYREAIALQPDLLEPRLALAEAAFQGRQEAFGLAVFRSYRNGGATLSPEFLRVEQLAAEAEAQRGNLATALGMYADLIPKVTAGKRVELQKTRYDLRVRQSLQVANLARRPIVSKEVTQHGLVKPKLTALPVQAELSVAPNAGDEQ